MADDVDEPDDRERRRRATWATAIRRDRLGDPRRMTANSSRADRDADQEHPEDQREDVRRVAGARRQQARPEDLVAERGQAGDEGEQQGERRAAPVGRRGRRRSARGGSRHAADGASSVPRAGLRLASSRAHDARDRRARRADHERAASARRLDQDEARGERPDDRPERVRRVEPPERLADRCASRLSCRVSVGSVAPMSTSRARARGSRARSGSGRGRCGWPFECDRKDAAIERVEEPERERRARARRRRGRARWRRTAAAATGRGRPAVRRRTLPMAIPPKKPVRIVDTAWVVLPKTSTSWRDQTTSYIEPGRAGQDEDREDGPARPHRAASAEDRRERGRVPSAIGARIPRSVA